MKKIERCRVLSKIISIWLYSTNRIPPEVNRIFLDWIAHDITPTNKQIKKLMNEYIN